MPNNPTSQIVPSRGECAAERLLAAVDGSGDADPLTDFGFRYDVKRRLWRRTERSPRRLPANVTRAVVAEAVGVPEALLERWELAVTKNTHQPPSVLEALSVGVKKPGKLSLEPLVSIGFRYFPRSQIWRRARADRNEVSRDVVAKKAAVPVDLLAAWEKAVREATTPSEGEP